MVHSWSVYYMAVKSPCGLMTSRSEDVAAARGEPAPVMSATAGASATVALARTFKFIDTESKAVHSQQPEQALSLFRLLI